MVARLQYTFTLTHFNVPAHEHGQVMVVSIPVLVIFGKSTLHCRETKCFFRGPEKLVKIKEQLQKELLVI